MTGALTLKVLVEPDVLPLESGSWRGGPSLPARGSVSGR